MTVQEFINSLEAKGYSNRFAQSAQTAYSSGQQIDLDLTLTNILEIDRLAVFKIWYGVTWSTKFDLAHSAYKAGTISASILYILTDS